MGGHADGALAAETAQKLLVEAFWHTPQPLFDPLGFLHLTLGRVHEAVVKLGAALPLEQRPRATCAVCLVQGDSAYWAHVGDSRVYHVRAGQVAERTRDHSHVEFLIREGLITEEQAQAHPDAQLRRMLRRRRVAAARDDDHRPPPARAGRPAAGLHRRLCGATLDDEAIARPGRNRARR
jgi:serine/threonine protein phosphatase PrpC